MDVLQVGVAKKNTRCLLRSLPSALNYLKKERKIDRTSLQTLEPNKRHTVRLKHEGFCDS